MAQPARQPAELDEAPPYDHAAVDQAYRLHRARRQARVHQRREYRLARFRFLLVACGLVLLSLVIAVTIWDQVQTLFGL